MQNSAMDIRGLAQSGIEALRRGDAAKARPLFESIVAAGGADASIFLALAFACGNLNDNQGAVVAVDRALGLEPDNLRALLFKADCFAASGDARAASAFYAKAIKVAPPLEQLPPDLRDELRRAQSMCDQYAGQFETVLLKHLAGTDIQAASARFTHSLDILLGKKKIYFQEPQSYYFPELPQIQFYDRTIFPWLEELEAATAEIRNELLNILNDGVAFAPYVQAEPNRPVPSQSAMLNNPDWSALYLWKNGEVVPENATRCPMTLKALENVPIARVPGRSPSILFSQLRPGARIPPHTGYVNTRLICHLPLIVPANCGFRVGNDTREWIEGKAWLFDDTIEHEAWNLSDKTRVILLFEIWRPELTADERKLVSSMFEAIDKHNGRAPEGNI